MKLLLLLASLSFLLIAPLHAESPLDPKGNAKITKNEAEHIALKHYPGARVTAAKLEKMRDTWVWSIEIARSNAKPVLVTVEARTGRVVRGRNAR